MFELGLTEEEAIVRDTARRFAAERLAPQARDHERARAVPDELAAGFEELGLGAVEEDSGTFAHVLVAEELSAADPAAALAIDRFGLAAHALREGPLDDLVREMRASPASRAIAVFDADREIAVAHGRASGAVRWVPADRADVVVVLQPDRLLVLRERFALRRVQACGLEAAGASELRLDDSPVIATIDDGFRVARAWSRSRVHVAALLVGAARAAREYATRYATERVAFGRPIAHHQGLAFLLVDLATAVDAARLCVWRAAAALDRGEAASWESAAALAEAAEQGLFVAPNAVQVLGGHGFMKDHPVEKWMRDVRTLAQLAGGRDRAELDCAALAAQHAVGLA